MERNPLIISFLHCYGSENFQDRAEKPFAFEAEGMKVPSKCLSGSVLNIEMKKMCVNKAKKVVHCGLCGTHLPAYFNTYSGWYILYNIEVHTKPNNTICKEGEYCVMCCVHYKRRDMMGVGENRRYSSDINSR